ncbi:MAG: Chromate resistance protein ChrB, partial [Acidobacteriota bacterium]
MRVTSCAAPWLLLAFELPARQASRRVEIWRKLRRYGALPFRNAGYLLPNRPDCLERMQWLAAAIRTSGGVGSVLEVHAIDDVPQLQLVTMFNRARDADYAEIARRLKGSTTDAQRTRLRRRLHEVAAIDYFESPMRGRVEGLLDNLERAGRQPPPTPPERAMKSNYRNRTWITRPQPGIDRAASAWLIR